MGGDGLVLKEEMGGDGTTEDHASVLQLLFLFQTQWVYVSGYLSTDRRKMWVIIAIVLQMAFQNIPLPTDK